MDAKTIGLTSALIALIASFTYVGVAGQEPTHYCTASSLKAYCYAVSSTNTTCYTLPARTGGKTCTSKWSPIPIMPIDNPVGHKYSCDTTRCVAID